VDHHDEAFVGIDASKVNNAVAIAEAGRGAEVRYLGAFDTSDRATRKPIASLAATHGKLTFCYEAGPTGYGLYRLIRSLGHDCVVVAPSLIPRKAGDHVKTNRRDAEGLARKLRAGELTAVWVPDERHEAMRGIDTVAAVTLVAEIGDLSRFASPRELMGYLGLAPSERSTGDSVARGGITKAGNRRARRILVEAAWAYRHPPRIGREKQAKVEAAPEAVREVAWKAQARLSGRFRALSRKGKRPAIVVTAIAREVAGFIWAIQREMAGIRASER
jgi:transposase